MLTISPRTLNWIFRSLPNFCWPLRLYLTKASLKKVGKNFRIGVNSRLEDHRLIEIGDNVFMGDGTIISVRENLSIGNDVMFGTQVMIIGGDHRFNEIGKPMASASELGSNLGIVLEADVWVGSRATILKGVTLREGSVIGSNAVVTKSTLPYSINVGNPAKFLRCRFSKDELERHLVSVHSKYAIDNILKLYSQSGVSL